ncbi:hypothetical protein AOQ84DRAFT_435244 [Glonium stellatum]|uniref:Uncharacterized protein n=1 Tax=Glonium stellatum TaxID=574774 RepID=A0A8E2JZ83_9PEZI|nr:hypothetical protein AOQ84DRAFT_435244 [Glonium stellatum]
MTSPRMTARSLFGGVEAHKKTSTTFFDLPRELRDIVYNIVTPAEDTARPRNQPYVGFSSRTAGFSNRRLIFADQNAEVQFCPVANTEIGLLYANKQLRSEYMEHHLRHGTIWAAINFFGDPYDFDTSQWLLKMRHWLAKYTWRHPEISKYWKMRKWYIRVYWRPHLERSTKFLYRPAGGIITDTVQGVLSLAQSDIRHRMDIDIDIFIVRWVLTMSSSYGLNLRLRNFFAVQLLGEVRPKRLSTAIFVVPGYTLHGGSVGSFREQRMVWWYKGGVLCLRKTEEVDQTTKKLVVGTYAGPETQDNSWREDMMYLWKHDLSALFRETEEEKPEDEIAQWLGRASV